jgi:hypothetical protein
MAVGDEGSLRNAAGRAHSSVTGKRGSGVATDLRRFARYPIYPRKTWLEKVILRLGFGGPAWCPVCGSLTLITRVRENLRETCTCLRCKSTNRQRQIAYVLCAAASRITGEEISSLGDLARLDELVVYNTEAGRQIHAQLSGMRNYICSEYFGDAYESGDIVGGKPHQDLMNLSFDERSIDLVISSDVFEHIPDPYKAHREVYRVLRRGGRHVFTVPFLQSEFLDQDRTMIDIRGNVIFTKEPLYHKDPVRPEGALVHKLFSLEMLVKLRKIGFSTNIYHIRKATYGIFGSNALVFEAVKE